MITMSKTTRFVVIAALAACAAAPLLAQSGEGKILYYQDPMHPWYHSDKPGIAPDCGMKLVPVYATEAPAAALPPGAVEISAARQQIMGVTTATAEYRAIEQVVRATGQVAVDD